MSCDNRTHKPPRFWVTSTGSVSSDEENPVNEPLKSGVVVNFFPVYS